MPLITRSFLVFLLPAALVFPGCGDDSASAVDDVEDEVSELRERVAALEAVVAGSGSGSGGDGSDGDGGGTGGGGTGTDGGGTGGDDGGTGGGDDFEARIVALEESVIAVETGLDDLESGLADQAAMVGDLQGSVDAIEADVATVVAGGTHVLIDHSGAVGGTASASTWSTIAGSETSFTTAGAVTLVTFGQFEFDTYYGACTASMYVELLDSAGTTLATGSQDSWRSGEDGLPMSVLVTDLPAAGTYRLRLMWTGSTCSMGSYDIQGAALPTW